MRHTAPILLSDLVVRNISPQDADAIIAKAINEQSLSGAELNNALVVSGAALGIDKLQAHVLAHMNAGMGMMRKTLADIDAAGAQFAGDDEGMALIAKLRAPIAERIQEHIGMYIAACAAGFSELFGVDESYVLARRIIEPTDTPEWKASSAATAIRHPQVFGGFVMSDVNKMKCPCSGHLLEAFHSKGHPDTVEVVTMAYKKYGSLETAMIEFLKHLLSLEFKRLDDFEATFGNLDGADSAEASEATEEILSRYLGGAVPPGADLDPH